MTARHDDDVFDPADYQAPKRKTSLEALDYIRHSRVLGELRTRAYQAVHDHGPGTAAEITKAAGIPGLWKRLSELREMDLIVVVDERPCRVTGHPAAVLDVTGKRPAGPYRPKRGRRERTDEARIRRETAAACARIARASRDLVGETIARTIEEQLG